MTPNSSWTWAQTWRLWNSQKCMGLSFHGSLLWKERRHSFLLRVVCRLHCGQRTQPYQGQTSQYIEEGLCRRVREWKRRCWPSFLLGNISLFQVSVTAVQSVGEHTLSQEILLYSRSLYCCSCSLWASTHWLQEIFETQFFLSFVKTDTKIPYRIRIKEGTSEKKVTPEARSQINSMPAGQPFRWEKEPPCKKHLEIFHCAGLCWLEMHTTGRRAKRGARFGPGVLAHTYNLGSQETEEENCKFEASLCYITRLLSQKTKEKKKRNRVRKKK